MDNLWKKESTEAGARYVDLIPFMHGMEHIGEGIIEKFGKKTIPIQKDNEFSTTLRRRGNEFFKAENWSKAMDSYNESLCFAEIGSENVALAYFNRSACFFRMRMYDEALADIELAKSANLPDRWLPTLEERQQECHKLMQTAQKSKMTRNFKLSYEANQNFPCMADVLEIKYNQEFGRHLVAKSDIPVGKIVLMEKEFIAAKDNERISCCTCFQKNKNFIACKQCPGVAFCDVDCIEKNLCHKWECGSAMTQFDFYQKFHVRAVLLAIESFQSVEGLMEFVDSALREDRGMIPISIDDLKSNYHFFFKLKKFPHTNGDILSVYKYFTCIKMCPKINALFDGEEKTRFLLHLMTHHFLIIKTNAIEEDQSKSLDNIFAMINHSCSPNLHNYSIGDKCFCETIRFVKKGEQLCINYLGLADAVGTEERQMQLKSYWNFDCKCEKCQAINNGNTHLARDPCFQFALKNMPRKRKYSAVLEQCRKFLNEHGHLPWSKEIGFMSSCFTLTFQELYITPLK
ncbi:SET and MYND domain-containing protein DDB_G0273589-like [Sitodiplosis mosellana]|uniref:SET and MYND domain-containing protein DDB_G0273589-like n=1 Tax=Sitodiplosis mosellana TaxID=263140 RepID=UPI0024447A37|nr:SET and MYND domain-containing protein DDB_G0273589-like [Sitodiplosis mosellana]